jgi:RsiW-degrading membrane proteinase PrsW (M82 family)
MKGVKGSVLNTGLMNLLGMVVLYLLSYFLFRGIVFSTGTTGGTLLIMICGFIPALLWLSFFYFLDRKEPEPIPMVIAAFMAGIVSEIIFSEFFGSTLFNLTAWIINVNALPVVHVLFSRGIIPALAIFLTLRYFFYPAASFNERVDGLMYGAFVAIGYSFFLSMKEIFASPEASLYYIVFSLLIRLAIFSALGALVGYYFGDARFKEKGREVNFLLSLVIAIVVFSVFAFLESRFQMSLTMSSDFVSIGLTLVFSIVLLAVVFILIQSAIKKGESRDMKALDFSIDLVSLVALVVFLVAGLAIRVIVEGDKGFTSEQSRVSFQIPASYHFEGEQDNLMTFKTNLGDERFPLMVKILIQESGMAPMLRGRPGAAAAVDEIGDYSVSLREYNRTVEEGGMGDRTFFARIYEYTASGEDQKLIISIISPNPYYPGHRGIVEKILKTIRKEA